ncbi:MAG TPA: response regulator transcription factor [Pyrinomonadaceae bacterium]|jgi:DNA-binding NarL/FixJ family response regulator|nr:response regulator transcription factor [Pyrinomonadaceae bacterium]
MAKRLLVVDDDVGLLLAVSDTLRAEGYDVMTARRGAEAMIRIAEALPDLIISDIRMPGMNGYQLVRNLRSNARTRLVPIVFLTAKDETTDRIAGFRTGVDAYVTKPFEPDELLAIVAGILERVQRTHSDLARLFGEHETANHEFQRDEKLTGAEWRVAETVARGLSNKEIAAELNLSLRTVEGHISRILDKEGLNNRVELALKIVERKNSD